MTPQRLQMETAILERYFSRKYKFENLNSSNSFLDVGVKTQSGKVYRLKIKLSQDYPNSLPEVYITYPLPLMKKDGSKLDGASHDFHTLGNEGDNIQICHFKSENWNPNQSLYKIALKVRIWLEAYEGHLRTGKTIDNYLTS
jgi:ubiquitin-protein ligase